MQVTKCLSCQPEVTEQISIEHLTQLHYRIHSLLKNSTYVSPRNRSQKFPRERNHIKHLLQSKENEKKKINGYNTCYNMDES